MHTSSYPQQMSPPAARYRAGENPDTGIRVG